MPIADAVASRFAECEESNWPNVRSLARASSCRAVVVVSVMLVCRGRCGELVRVRDKAVTENHAVCH